MRRGLFFISLWALAFGLLQVLLQVLILARFGSIELTSRALVQVLTSFPGHVATGAALTLLAWFARPPALAALLFLPTVPLLFFNTFAFHYHAVFGTPPGWSVIAYIREIRTLNSSIGVDAPQAWFWSEVVLSAGIMAALLWVFRRRASARPAPGRAIAGSAAAPVLACIAATIVFHALPPGTVPPSLARAGIPLVGFLRSVQKKAMKAPAPDRISADDILRFRAFTGAPAPAGEIDLRFPMCSTSGDAGTAGGNGRSLLLLILENVGRREMSLKHEGRPVMPKLAGIAAKNMSFVNVFAAGTQSCQALPALFSGLPAQPSTMLLWEKPMKQFEGFPSRLASHGYRTAYFHGGDLSFEQQRQYLEMAGFEEIHEYDPSRGFPVYGWGWSDGEVMRQLKDWVWKHRKRKPQQPYAAALYTLTSHHPYALPPEHAPVFKGKGKMTAFYESLRYLDDEIGAFHAWYLKNEAPRGTLLVITGDHSPLIANTEASERDEFMRFDVPLVVVSPDENERAALSTFTGRYGGHSDVPATLADLLDLPRGRCDQGVSLVSQDPAWPEDRFVYGVTGKELSKIYVWSRNVRGIMDAWSGKFVTLAAAPGDREGWGKKVAAFVSTLVPLSRYLIAGNAFAPPTGTAVTARAPLPRVETPIFAAHCGNVDGMLPLDRRNRLEAVEDAIAAGFEWVEIDANITKDRAVVLIHDGTVVASDGGLHPVSGLTLDELRTYPDMEGIDTLGTVVGKVGHRVNLLIEAKPQANHIDEGDLAAAIARIVKKRKGDREVIVDSFGLSLAASIKKQCGCAVAFDVPWSKTLPEEWLKTAAVTHLDWVYIHSSMATPEAIAMAHRHGLKVMVFTVNDVAALTALAPEFPDGVITDYLRVAKEFRDFLENGKTTLASLLRPGYTFSKRP
jgi:glycerophosphoryl diester phosphodiesterase/arylsulfatase A-like enzyme